MNLVNSCCEISTCVVSGETNSDASPPSAASLALRAAISWSLARISLRKGDAAASAKAGSRVLLLNQQLDQSNPVLTAIADAMTAEASALECGNAAVAETMRKRKTELTTQLQEMSDRFSLLTSEAS